MNSSNRWVCRAILLFLFSLSWTERWVSLCTFQLKPELRVFCGTLSFSFMEFISGQLFPHTEFVESVWFHRERSIFINFDADSTQTEPPATSSRQVAHKKARQKQRTVSEYDLFKVQTYMDVISPQLSRSFSRFMTIVSLANFGLWTLWQKFSCGFGFALPRRFSLFLQPLIRSCSTFYMFLLNRVESCDLDKHKFGPQQSDVKASVDA